MRDAVGRSGVPDVSAAVPALPDALLVDTGLAKRTGPGSLPQTGLTTARVLLESLRQAAVEALPVEAVPLHLVVLEGEKEVLPLLDEAGRAMGFTVHAGAPEDADRVLGYGECDLVLLDLSDKTGGLNLLRRIRKEHPRVPVLVTTSFASIQVAAEALRMGATDFLTKPYCLQELTSMLHLIAEQRSFDIEQRRLRLRANSDPALQEMAAASPAMQKLLGIAARVALSEHPVLVLGESGSGKKRLCRILHSMRQPSGHGRRGDRESGAPFFDVSCSTQAAALLESELFGFVRNEGSPDRDECIGLLTKEGGGTLLLDEVDALSPDLQAKLVRALQTRSVRPPGGAMHRPVTVRVVASSSRDVPSLVERGTFRKDLYFKLSVVTLRVPPLRQRRADIPLLAAVFLERYGRERSLNFSFGSDALRALLQYDWPGNVCELQAVIARACSLSSGPVLHLGDLASQLQQHDAKVAGSLESVHIDARSVLKPEAPSTGPIEPIATLERRAILGTLDRLNGDKLMAAKLLGIGKTTLYRKLKEYGID